MKYFQHEKAIVDPKALIGDNTRIWAFVNVQGGTVIGHDCNICDGSFVEKGAVIGSYVTIKHNVSIFSGVTLEDHVFCGCNVGFINDRYPRSYKDIDWTLEKTLVKKGASLGTNSTILCGVTIGEFAVVGAGCVVTKDIPAHTIVHGNPARPVGYACQCGRTLNKLYQCSCGKKYVLKGESLEFYA